MYYSDDYLAHYGVLGMRWGVHNASRAASKSASTKRKALIYKDSDTEKYNKLMGKSKKLSEKSARITAKHKARAGKAYDYTNNESLGKSIGKSVLFSTYGALKYNELRGSGNGRIASAGAALLSGAAQNYSGTLVGIIEPRVSGSLRKSGSNGLGEVVSPKLKTVENAVSADLKKRFK